MTIICDQCQNGYDVDLMYTSDDGRTMCTFCLGFKGSHPDKEFNEKHKEEGCD